MAKQTLWRVRVVDAQDFQSLTEEQEAEDYAVFSVTVITEKNKVRVGVVFVKIVES